MLSYKIPIILISIALSLLTTRIHALEYNQHIKLNASFLEFPDSSPLNINEDTSQGLQFLNYRLNVYEQVDSLQFETHYELMSLHSDRSDLQAINPDKYRLFDLTSEIKDSSSQQTYHRLDRFFINHNSDNINTRFGRQAITWGNGFVFNVMDLFNPFSPTALDTEYKPGDDMIYIQMTQASNADWQFIYLPRRDLNNDIKKDESSFAAKFHTTISSSDIDVLVSQHYSEEIIGFGFNHPVADSMWRLDITHTRTDADTNITSLSTNLDYSWTSFNKNFYGFVEYYYNGFGIDAGETTNASLLNRVARGELHTLFKRYLAIGLRIEIHPLINISPTLIQNLTDNSALLSLNAQYDWLQNLSISAQLLLSQGDSESEYGGPSSQGDSLNLLMSLYF